MESATLQLATEQRAEVEGRKLNGYAAVFEQATRMGDHFEVIGRSAFEAIEPTAPVVFTKNHDANLVLGRSTAGTLRWWTDTTGLGFEVDLPDTQIGRDVAEEVRRGDLDGASFKFAPGADEWRRAQDGTPVRRHLQVKRLVDTAVVTFPAYPGASVELRSLGELVEVESNRSRLVRVRHAIRQGG